MIGLKKGAIPNVFDDSSAVCSDLNSCSQEENEQQIVESTYSEPSSANEDIIHLTNKLVSI